MNKKKAFIIIGIFWLLVLSGFVAFKEYTLRVGREVILNTVPVDPRDLFRGDYVVLRYEVSTTPVKSKFKVGDTVYVSLNVDSSNVATFFGVSSKKPSSELFLKGKVKTSSGGSISIEYGIESYFVPEGKGWAIQGSRGNVQVKVAIDKFGKAVIKNLVIDGKDLEVK